MKIRDQKAERYLEAILTEARKKSLWTGRLYELYTQRCLGDEKWMRDLLGESEHYQGQIHPSNLAQAFGHSGTPVGKNDLLLFDLRERTIPSELFVKRFEEIEQSGVLVAMLWGPGGNIKRYVYNWGLQFAEKDFDVENVLLTWNFKVATDASGKDSIDEY